MKTTFRTDEYLMSHGKAPKGEGSWYFEMTAYAPSRGSTALNNNEPFLARGTYMAAKKLATTAAKAEAKSIGGVETIYIDVCP